MKLLNVRLREEDVAHVRELRRRGVRISDLVRASLAKAAAAPEGRGSGGRRSVAEFLRELDKLHPIPPTEPPHGIDVSDRRAVARHLRGRFHSGRRR